MLQELLRNTRATFHQKNNNQKDINSKIADKITAEDFGVIHRVIGKAADREFKKRSTKLSAKFELLSRGKQQQLTSTRSSTITKPVLQLQKKPPLNEDEVAFLSLGPQYSLTPRDVTMDIVSEIEPVAQALEREGGEKKEIAAALRHDVCNTLLRLKKPKLNLTHQQKKGFHSIKQKIKNKEIKVAPYDKGKRFVVLDPDDLKQKTLAEMGNVTLNTKDDTQNLQKKINDTLNRLHQEEKLTETVLKKLKTTDPLTPSAWTAIKAHKPEKDHPARIVISHIGCPQEHLAKELIRIIQPLNQKCPFDIKNSTDLARLVKKWNLNRDDVIFSVDAKALFPSIPIAECIRLISKDLQEDATLPDRKNLILTTSKISHLHNLSMMAKRTLLMTLVQ
jgi:hypothetical protein